MNKYILGIDGGGTKTLGALFNEKGEIVLRVENGFSNFSANEEISKQNIEKTLDDLYKGLVPGDEIIHIQLGIAGHSKLINKEEYIAHLKYKYNTSVNMTNDAIIALYSVKRDLEMNVIMVLGGTGSVIMISDDSGSTIIGGFGHLLGDEGSSYHLSITALRNIIKESEEDNEYSELSLEILNEIGAETHYGISKFVYNTTKSGIAQLSKFIASIALKGNKEAIELFVNEGIHLGRQTYSAYQKLGTSDVVMIGIKGGFLLNAPYVKETLIKELDRLNINYEISEEQVEPVIGAYYYGLKNISKERHHGWYK